MSATKLDEIKLAIKDMYMRTTYPSLDEYIKNECKADEHAVNQGPITIEISRRITMSLIRTRYYLNKYHKEGLLLKFNTGSGCCRWWYKGLIDELNNTTKTSNLTDIGIPISNHFIRGKIDE